MRSIPAAFFVLICLIGSAAANDLAVSPEQQRNLGIALAKVQRAADRPVAVLPATIRAPRDSRVVVIAPYSGTVTDVAAMEGETVSTGKRLATVFSRDLLASQSQLTQLRAELAAAAAAAERTRLLASEGVIAGARAQDAEARAAGLRAQIAEEEQMLRAVAADRKRPGYYELLAPSGGRIAGVDVEPGSTVEAMATAVAIEKSGTLWADAQLPPELAKQVETGAAVLIGETQGKVIARGIAADPKTRSVLVRAEVPSNGLMGGTAVNMTILAPMGAEGFRVPRSAVIRVAGNDSVFVSTKTGFRVSPVTIVGKEADALTVTGDLAPGQIVASAGVVSLKAMAEN